MLKPPFVVKLSQVNTNSMVNIFLDLPNLIKSISSEYLKLPGEPIIMSGSKSLIIFL